jgi:hypothetical protein
VDTSSKRLAIWQLVEPKPITTEGDAMRFAALLDPRRGIAASLRNGETIKPPAPCTPQRNQHA